MRDDEGMKQVNITLATALLAAILPLSGLPASAQSTEADIVAKLKDKPLFLMGLWADDKLKFDAQGHPTGNYKLAPFTVCGMHVDKVNLHGSHLKLEGEREGITFDRDDTMTRLTMMVGSGPNPKDMKPEKMSVEIDNGDSRDFEPALNAIFTEDSKQFASVLPDFWQPYFRKHFGVPPLPVQPTSLITEQKTNKASHVGGTVRPPKLIHNVEPEFSEDARRMKISGNVQVYLWVDENGNPSHVVVVRPAGMGLDEKAIEAVKQYHFSPALRDGKPITVDIYIDVNFQIF